jgi:thiamine biosynthesis lipoprotein
MNFIKLLIIVSCIIIFVTSCSKNNLHVLRGNAFGSIYHVTFNTKSDLDLIDVKSNIENIISLIDRAASSYNYNSEISVFNRLSHTRFITISSNLSNILQKSNLASEMTNGFFDITVGNIKIYKGFYGHLKSNIVNKGSTFDFKDIVLSQNKNLLRKNSIDINVDLSGIAKGYAVDLIYNYLLSKGINNFVVNIGGEIKVHSDSERLPVSIDDPSAIKQSSETVYLLNEAIATSGTYIDSIIYDDQEISHIINPFTSNNISKLNLLVSVIHTDCVIADALATGLIAMSVKDIINFSNANNISSMLIVNNNKVLEKYYSENFIKYLEP